MKRNRYFEDEVVENQFNQFMLKRLIYYAKDYKSTYIKVIAMLIGTSFLSLVPASINMIIIDNVLPEGGSMNNNVIKWSVILLSLWFALSIGSVIAGYITSVVSSKLGNTIVCNLRKDLFDKLMELSFNYYDSRPVGKILVRVTNYTDEIANFFINDMVRIVQNVFIMLIAIIYICMIEIRIAATAILVSVPMAIIMWKLAKSLHNRMVRERNKQSNRTAFVVENINGLEVIKAFNREEMNNDIFIELSEKYKNEFMRATRVRELFFPLAHGIINGVCTIMIYLMSLLIITKNSGTTLNLGAVVTIATYMQRFSNSVNVVCQRLQTIANVTSNIERIFEVLDEEVEISEADEPKEPECFEGKVEFNHVTFSYGGETNVLEDINLTVNPGEMIALIGPTGAGKTTIVSLVSRFYDIKEGELKIDGVNVSEMSIKSLRENVGVMMQDTFLFEGSIIDNIRFSKPDATDEECINAAKTVYAHDFIMRKPDGYHTILTNQASELSGGEKQLVSFARLILSNPKIIILDEATSNIDTETEKLIQKVFSTVLKGRTSFIIAHRLSTIKNADRIILVDNKTIQEKKK